MIKCNYLSFLFCLIAILSSCRSSPTQTRLSHFAQNVMTIDYHITIGDPLTMSQKEQVQRLIETTFQEVDMIYNKWNPHSELSQLNALPAHTPFALSPQLAEFLKRVDNLVSLSEGRFDPTVEPLQQLWKGKLEKEQCPTREEIDNLKSCIGWQTLHIANGILYKEDGRTQLDLGGVAKGYCVDLLIERLRQLGLNSLYVEWGGEIRTLGFHPSGRPWRVFISRYGDPNPEHAIAQVDLINHALATSGDYFQYWTVKDEQGTNKIYCHIFHPLTLSPVEVKTGSVASASLLALDCMTADALAKVLMLFDSSEKREAWIKKLQQHFPDLDCWIVTTVNF